MPRCNTAYESEYLHHYYSPAHIAIGEEFSYLQYTFTQGVFEEWMRSGIDSGDFLELSSFPYARTDRERVGVWCSAEATIEQRSAHHIARERIRERPRRAAHRASIDALPLPG